MCPPSSVQTLCKRCFDYCMSVSVVTFEPGSQACLLHARHSFCVWFPRCTFVHFSPSCRAYLTPGLADLNYRTSSAPKSAQLVQMDTRLDRTTQDAGQPNNHSGCCRCYGWVLPCPTIIFVISSFPGSIAVFLSSSRSDQAQFRAPLRRAKFSNR
jgi:hypothetical protein